VLLGAIPLLPLLPLDLEARDTRTDERKIKKGRAQTTNAMLLTCSMKDDGMYAPAGMRLAGFLLLKGTCSLRLSGLTLCLPLLVPS
jgi:hypothetical protein